MYRTRFAYAGRVQRFQHILSLVGHLPVFQVCEALQKACPEVALQGGVCQDMCRAVGRDGTFFLYLWALSG